MKKNEFEILYLIKKEGESSVRNLAAKANISVGTAFKIKNLLREQNLIDENGIREEGIKALEPYKVDNAIIMAAGMSSRFVPLSLEKPKGLLEVKGEILIERQIEQLHQAGIYDITIVLGYKKESFFYLSDKYQGLNIVINPEYNTKNNVYTLYLAKDYLKNTYICSSDDYFTENVFEPYVYKSYYAAIHITEKSNEWYMIKNNKNEIVKVNKFGEAGDIMLGHVYWNREFSQAMKEILVKNSETGEYDDCLWEEILKDHVNDLPKMLVNVYPNNVIFEFDSLDELRQFDKSYIKNTRSKIMQNISRVFACEEDEIREFKPIKEGMTNDSFVFTLRNKKYVYRNPGEGTNEIIDRTHEKKALMLAKEIGVDPTFIYMDDETGFKISHFVENFREPNYFDKADTTRVVKLLRKLHKQNLKVDWEYLPFEETFDLEKKVLEKGPIEMPDYNELKERIIKINSLIKDDGIERRFCHCDVYSPNLLFTDNETILIDWEYAGNADPGCDLAVYIMCASYSVEDAISFIKEYLGAAYTEKLERHFLAYVAICSFFWLTWALYREACGAVMGEALYNWYCMAKTYSAYILK